MNGLNRRPPQKASKMRPILMYLATPTLLQFLLVFQVFLQKSKGFSLLLSIILFHIQNTVYKEIQMFTYKSYVVQLVSDAR